MPLPSSPPPRPSLPCPLPHTPTPLSSTTPTADDAVRDSSPSLRVDLFEITDGPEEIVLAYDWQLAMSQGPRPRQAASPRNDRTPDRHPPTIKPARDTGKPRWEPDAHRLTMDGKVCKTWKKPPLSQGGILQAFEEAEWRRRIEHPEDLDGYPLVDGRLRETVRELNKDMKYIRFFCDGTGRGVTWSLKQGGRRRGR
jgi:hypothetical protein